jgi:glucose/arabinose dehydrogenase
MFVAGNVAMKNLFFVSVVLLCSAITASAAPTLKDPNLQVTEVVSGLSSPTTMAFIGPDDLLVLQKNDGKVRRVIGGVLQANSVLDVNVDNSSERGLLGIALHPGFPASPFVYLYFTESTSAIGDTAGSAAGNRVYRYTWDGSRLTNPTLILDLPVTSGPNHNGGIVMFGPDGKLYVVIGDLNRNGQLQNNSTGAAPDDTSVIFRLNDDGSTPNDNPFFAQGGNVARYYAYGIRNSFGMTFDPVTGKLWMTENGPDSYDEINQVEPGFNSGWNKIMGPDGRDRENVSDLFSLAGSQYGDPKFSWLATVGPTGIVFLTSTELGAQYQFDAFVGDINNGNLYRFKPNAARDGLLFSGAGLADLVADTSTELDEVIFGTGFNGITDLKIGPDGLLYVISFGDGKIYAISSGDGKSALAFGVSSLPIAEVGVSYSTDLAISGGTPPYTVNTISGSLPPGLALVSQSISGTPTINRRARITVRVTDQLGASATKRFRLLVVRAVTISTRTLPFGRVGRRSAFRVAAVRGKKPYAWSVIAGALPSGLTLDSTTGRITGTPVSVESADLTFQVTDSLGGVAQKSFVLTIK